MNPIAEEILMHYGMPRRSGRYPWGSGDNPYQHNDDFLARVEKLKAEGWEETPENIKKEFGMTTTEYRKEKSIAKNERRRLQVARAKSLREDGKNTSEIAREMGVNESTVRSWFNEESEARMNRAQKTAESLKKIVDERGMIDVGTGVEREIGVSKEQLNQALKILEDEGYPTYSGGVPQVTNPGKQTTQKVLCPPGTEHKEIYDYENVHSLNEYVSRDGGETFDKFVYPKSMDSSRLAIRYAEEGGIDKDGIIEIRRGCKDLDLGPSHYAQVRILVDDNKYLKGMAVYSDDLPDGVDVVFNTNKKVGTDKMDVLKDIKKDPDNPFGSLIKPGGQSYYIDDDGNKQLSLINKRADEGDWEEWSNNLPSQFLSKQPLPLAKKQLNLASTDKNAEFEEICSLTNPTVKKHLLESFADDCDATAVHLKAAALPGQKYHVIIPITSLKDDEIYAPNYPNGTKLALVRYPHGGTFEIPIVTVNNKHPVAKKTLGTDIVDAVGINAKVAERLSGADFDGDTVMCIPTHDKGGKVKVASTPTLKGLKGFDPKEAYPEKEGMQYMSKRGTQLEMGKISNLITDMTLKGATQDELAAAVRHSMVVIDAHKHKLDYKQSEQDNNIAALRKKYQRQIDEDGNEHFGGASTLISRAKSEESVDKRQGSPKVNLKGKEWYDPSRPEGALIYKTADDVEYTVKRVNKKTGEEIVEVKRKKQQSTKMAETDDAYTLVSDMNTDMERAYADYANGMKSLANRSRVEMANTGKIEYSSAAKKTYEEEVKSLNAKLRLAQLNAPKEREAQRRANSEIARKKKENPGMTKEEIKKASQQAIAKYRNEVSSVSRRERTIKITEREWEAIQAGAISENTLKSILKNTDIDEIRKLATPRSSSTLSESQISRIKAYANSNYTAAEIAAKLGVSTSTVNKYMKGDN